MSNVRRLSSGPGAYESNPDLMNTRTATEADLDQVSALADEIAALHSSNEPEVFAAPNAGRDREFWLSCITQTDATVNVATNAGVIVGFITAKITSATAPTFLKDRTICRIGTIVVSSTVQRRGIGTELIRSIETWARVKSAVEIRLEVFAFNRQALSFYASLGYATQSHNMHRGLV
jgi:ribosomal protein S18 acetylase RimI-like enzyme